MRNHAYSQEDYAEDPEFFDDMKEGKYDVICKHCSGNGRYITVQNTNDMLENHYQAEREYRAEVE